MTESQNATPSSSRRRALIGIVGQAGAGKSTLARLIAERHAFEEESLAAPLKAVCAALFGFTNAQLFGPSEARNEVDPRWGFAPRKALQFIGTEVARGLHKDVWVRALLRTLAQPGAPRFVVVSDVRFQNEVDAIHAAGGKVVKISGRGGAAGEAAVHASEQVEQLHGVDFWIDNSSSLDSLVQAADALVEEVLS